MTLHQTKMPEGKISTSRKLLWKEKSSLRAGKTKQIRYEVLWCATGKLFRFWHSRG